MLTHPDVAEVTGRMGGCLKTKRKKKRLQALQQRVYIFTLVTVKGVKNSPVSHLFTQETESPSVPHDCRPVPKLFKESFSVFLCEMQLTDSFPNRNYKYCPTKTIHEHSTRSTTFFVFPIICAFMVFDSASQWSVPSSGGSVVRVVGDRTQFCFGALLLLHYLEYAPVSTTGGRRGRGGAPAHRLWTGAWARQRGHASSQQIFID